MGGEAGWDWGGTACGHSTHSRARPWTEEPPAAGRQRTPQVPSGRYPARPQKSAFENISKSVQFNCSVVSDSLQPHEPQHASPPCPLPTSRLHPSSCPLSQWCHPIISSFVVPFSSCPQSFPASGSFQMSQVFASGGQSIGVSASTSVLPLNT